MKAVNQNSNFGLVKVNEYHEATAEQACKLLLDSGFVDTESMTIEGSKLLELCGYNYSRVRDGIRKQIASHNLVEDVDYFRDHEVAKVDSPSFGRPAAKYNFTWKAANQILLAALTEQGKAARDNAYDTKMAVQNMPWLADLTPEFNEMLTISYNKRIAAERERDEAIRTKAQVSAGRNATLLSKSGRDAKKIAALETEVTCLRTELDERIKEFDADASNKLPVFPQCSIPSNLRSTSAIVRICSQRYGLSEFVTKLIVESRLNPVASVENVRDGVVTYYAVYPLHSVTEVFSKFVGECTKVSGEYATHPSVQRKFKLTANPENYK